MILKDIYTELEITPERFEGIYLHHLSTDAASVYRQPQEGEVGFPFAEAHDNWIDFQVALRREGQAEVRHYAKGMLLPQEAYYMGRWLQDVAKGTEPLFPSLMFSEPDFQHIFPTSSTDATVTIRFESGVGGPPFPNLEIEVGRAALLQASEEFEADLFAMFRKYNYPLDLLHLTK